MPIPSPTVDETKQEFVNRCMGDEVMKSEFPETDQRLAVCTVQTQYGEKPNRVCFQFARKKKKGSYEVNENGGTISDVSLIQTGEAKGHGMYIDEKSLDSALEVIGRNLPAYVTHEGAIESDRLLNEIGVFSGFYIDEEKLKAENFSSFKSFREDEPERFRRLFDLAREMPDAFGLSLVFEAELVWVLKDGSEVSANGSEHENALRDLPSVRFLSIKSADFVDAPAANEAGLFSKSNQGKTKMAQEIKEGEEKLEAEEVVEKLEEEVEEVAETSDSEVESELDLTDEEQAEIDKLRDDIGRHDDRLNELEDGIADLKERLLSEKAKNKQLSSIVKGEDDTLPMGDESTPQSSSLVEKFNSANGAEQTAIWNKNKAELLSAFRRN